jgi:hypothetical protein
MYTVWRVCRYIIARILHYVNNMFDKLHLSDYFSTFKIYTDI